MTFAKAPEDETPGPDDYLMYDEAPMAEGAPHPAIAELNQYTSDKIAIALKAIEAARRAIDSEMKRSHTKEDLVRIFFHNRVLNDVIDENRKRFNQPVEELSKRIIPELFKQSNVRTITLADVGRVSIGTNTSGKVVDKKAAYNWLKANGHDGLITLTINASTLGAFCKTEFLEKNIDPPECFEVSQSAYTSVTKLSSKK